MKTFLTSLLLLLAFAAHGQTTNITISITVTVPGVSTNTTAGTLNYGTPKDLNLINGVVWQYNTARAGGYTNRLDRYIGQIKILDDFKAAANEYNRIVFNAQLQAAIELFTIYPDLVTQPFKDSLAEMAAARAAAP